MRHFIRRGEAWQRGRKSRVDQQLSSMGSLRAPFCYDWFLVSSSNKAGRPSR